MTINNLQWKIGGEAGMGIMTTGLLFSRICTRGGLNVFAYPEYPSLIRGGHNTYQVAVGEDTQWSQRKAVELLVALNAETIDMHADALVEGAAVIFDPADFTTKGKYTAPSIEGKNIVWVPVEMDAVIKEKKATKVARNTVAIGATFALLDHPFELVEAVIRDWFGGKKPEFVESNVELARTGYEAIEDKNTHFEYQLHVVEGAEPKMVIGGNQASAIGALKAGMKFYAAYPMTPSSGFLSYFAKQENNYDLVVKHTEDELAAMNMVIGAGFAGVRAMTATSGGGFALMGEALGMAGLAEVPLVAINGQRTGPSTGLPTWTAQADLRFILHASHGEWPRIVLTPGDAEECFRMTFDAFNLAEKYQTPVIIVIDKYNQLSSQSFAQFNTEGMEVDRGQMITQEELDKIVEGGNEFLRYEHTENGISKRVIPGMPGGRHIAGSYEHEENGYTTEDEEETIKQNDGRFKKLEKFLAEDVKDPEIYGPEDADVTIVGWGSTKLPAMSALQQAEAAGVSINYMHFTYVDPLPVEAVEAAFAKTKKTLFVEGNIQGQLEGWIRQHTGLKADAHFRKYGGRPFYPEELLEEAQKLS